VFYRLSCRFIRSHVVVSRRPQYIPTFLHLQLYLSVGRSTCLRCNISLNSGAIPPTQKTNQDQPPKSTNRRRANFIPARPFSIRNILVSDPVRLFILHTDTNSWRIVRLLFSITSYETISPHPFGPLTAYFTLDTLRLLNYE
jgi:hypothetical protein